MKGNKQKQGSINKWSN